MKNVKVELHVDPEIFKATQQFMDEKGLKIETELSDSLARLYKKYVPTDVRKYIERNAPPTHAAHIKSSDSASNKQDEAGSVEPVSPGKFTNSGSLPSEHT